MNSIFLLQYNFETLYVRENKSDNILKFHTDEVFSTYDEAYKKIINEFPYKTCRLLSYTIYELEVIHDGNPDFYLLSYEYYTYNLLGKRLFINSRGVFKDFATLLRFIGTCKNVIRYSYLKCLVKEKK